MTAWLVLLLGAAPLCTESTRVLFFDGLRLSRPYEVAGTGRDGAVPGERRASSCADTVYYPRHIVAGHLAMVAVTLYLASGAGDRRCV